MSTPRAPTKPQRWQRRVTWKGASTAWKKALDATKRVPGALFLESDKVWLLPDDAFHHWALQVRKAGATPVDLGHAVGRAPGDSVGDAGRFDPIVGALSALHPWQMQAVPRLADEGGVVSFATGLGKTATALRAMALDARLSGSAPSALIVTPALVKSHWAREIRQWWPEAAEHVAVLEDGAWAAVAGPGENAPSVVIASPELLPQVPVIDRRWLVLDECDLMKTTGTRRTSAALAHRAAAAKVIALSATLVSKEPDDLWQVLDLIWPGRFGRDVWAFRRAYMNLEERTWDGGRATVATGLREDAAPALASRLGQLVHLATHDDPEVAALLPPFELESTWLPAAMPYAGEWTPDAISKWMGDVAGTKTRAACELVIGAQEPVCILTHLRETAEEIARALAVTERGAVVAHGGSAVGPRLRKVAAAIDSGSHLVATMHSLGVGIDLTRFRKVIFGELYWVPRVLIQAMGRFRRLSSDQKARVRIDLLCLRGSPDEAMSMRLRRRLEDQAALLRGGDAHARLLDALAPMSEAEALAELRATAASMRAEDPYLAGGDDD